MGNLHFCFQGRVEPRKWTEIGVKRCFCFSRETAATMLGRTKWFLLFVWLEGLLLDEQLVAFTDESCQGMKEGWKKNGLDRNRWAGSAQGVRRLEKLDAIGIFFFVFFRSSFSGRF